MIAPAGMFKLAEKDKDPLLFVPMGGGYHYLLAQWGNDLHLLRKALVYPFRDFESLMKTVFIFCLAVALLFPGNLMRGCPLVIPAVTANKTEDLPEISCKAGSHDTS